MNNKEREELISIICDMYSPSSRSMFLKYLPKVEEDEEGTDFEDYFELSQTLLALMGDVSDAERPQIASTVKEKLKKYGLPENVDNLIDIKTDNGILGSL